MGHTKHTESKRQNNMNPHHDNACQPPCFEEFTYCARSTLGLVGKSACTHLSPGADPAFIRHPIG